MKSKQFSKNLFKICGLVCFAAIGVAQVAKADNLEGQDSLNTNGTPSGVWTTGNLQNWRELQYIPCRETLNAGPVTGKVFTVNFPHASGGTPGIENLTSFTNSPNVIITAGPTLTQAGDNWTYTVTVNINNNQPGNVGFNARMRAGAHNFPGSALKLDGPPLQIHKPAAAVGAPDLIVKKIGPALASAGQTITYTLYYTNQSTGANGATGVQLTDTLPGAVTYVAGSVTGGGAFFGNNIVWDLPDLATNAVGFVTYQVRVNTNAVTGSTFQNSAQILSAENDADYADNTSVVTTTVGNAAPVANPDSYTVVADTLLTVPVGAGVLTNDIDSEGDSLSAIFVSGVTHGILTLNTNGSFTYQPATDYVGTDTFTYRANDGHTNSTVATVTITVTGVPVVIVTPSVNQTNCPETTAQFNVTATGTAVSYQWYYGVDLLGGQTNNSLILSNVSFANAGTYSVVVSGAAGGPLTNSASLTVNTNVVVVNAPTGQTNCPGGTANFGVNATGTQLSYQWYFGTNALSGETNSTLSLSSVTAVQEGNYSVVVSGVCGSPVTNNTTLTVNQPVLVTDPPVSQTSVVGSNAVLSVGVTGTGLTYQWFFNDHVIGTNSTLNLSNLTTNSAGTYCSVVSGVCGNPATNCTTLTISNRAPVAVADNYEATEDTLLTVTAPGVLGNDSDVEGSPLTAALVSGVSHGTLNFNTDGSFTYLPTTNYNGSDTFSYQANDGSVNSGTVTVTINVGSVNDAPVVNIFSPTNDTVFVAGQNATIIADAFDPDGSITNVQFFVGTNQLSLTTNAPYLFVWTNLVAGVYDLTAVGTDNEGLSVTSSVVTISVIDKLALTFVGPIVYDGQVNLFKQVIRVSNPSPSSLPAARVLVFNLETGVKVFNANGTNAGIPFVQFNQLIGPGEVAELTIEYYVPNRVAPSPILVVELVPTFTPVVLTGTPQPITRAFQFASNKTFLLEFPTLLNRFYAVQYSSDLVEWKTVVPTISGNGSQIQWIDNGAPKTESAPAITEKRFYKVILLP